MEEATIKHIQLTVETTTLGEETEETEIASLTSSSRTTVQIAKTALNVVDEVAVVVEIVVTVETVAIMLTVTRNSEEKEKQVLAACVDSEVCVA